MKKVMLTVFMTILTPMVGNYVISNGVCKADEVIHIRPNNWPDVSPVYSSYYNNVENRLYIYGAERSNVVTVKVLCEGQTVLFDTLSPESFPAIYDFNNSKSGIYQVIVSDERTILTSFEFYKD